MDNSLKIVLSTLALYVVLSVQFLVEKGVFIIPYEFNPLVIWTVSGIIVLDSLKRISFKTNLIYFIGMSVYCFLSERTLNLIFNRTEIDFFIEIIQNPFTRLVSILGLLISVLTISFGYRKQKFGIYLLVLFGMSGVFGLINIRLAYVSLFSLFVLGFLISINLNKDGQIQSKFSPVVYQLFLFAIIEGIFSFTL